MNDSDRWTVEPEPLDPVHAAGRVARIAPQTDMTDAQLAWVADLATRVTPEAVAAELSRGKLPAFMQRDFVGRFRAATAHILAEVDARGPRLRDVYLAPAIAARAARAATDAKLEPWSARIDAFADAADTTALGGEPDEALVDEALRLRRDYVAACREAGRSLEGCLGDALGGRLTAVIDRLAASRGDQALRFAEYALRSLPDRSDPRTDERIAADEALQAERSRFEAYDAARRQGVAPAVIAARWPTAPIDVVDQALIGIPAEPRPAPNGPVPHELDQVVRAIQRDGDRATIVFAEQLEHSVRQTGCHETDRIDSIARDGAVTYRVECTGSDEQVTTDRTPPPVEVRWEEVELVKPGEKIHVAFDDARHGHVVSVGEPDRVQLRDLRI